MDKHKLFEDFFEPSVEYNSILQNIKECAFPMAIFGVEWASFLFNIVALLKAHKKMVLILESEADVLKAQEAILPHFENIYLLPKLEIAFFDSYAHSHQIENQRLEALYALLEDELALVITTADAMFMPMISPEGYLQNTKKIHLDDKITMELFIEQLVECGYIREERVEAKGQFAVRGGIVDVFLMRYKQPLRIEFFGDDIDSIRKFDLETQLSTENIDRLTLRPCREGILFKVQLPKIVEHLKDKISVIGNLTQKKMYQVILETLQNNTYSDERYKNIPVYMKAYSDIFDYIGDTLIAIWGYNRIVDRNQSRYLDWTERFKQHLERGEVVSDQLDLFFSPNRWNHALQRASTLVFSGLKTPVNNLKLQAILDYNFREGTNYSGKLDLAAADFKHWLSHQYRIFILVEGDDKINGVKRWLADYQLDERAIHIIDKDFCGGFSIDTFKSVVITERELYGSKQISRRKKAKASKAIRVFTDLEIGDFVVHDTHGIGKYLGVHQLIVDGQKKDFLKVVYRADDLLYVPVEKMEILQKYIGAEVKRVKLSRLGTTEWKQAKQKVKKAVEDMTEELVALYAEREKRTGYAFSKDGDWQRQFEDAFPYRETDDQLRCIEEIKRDMESLKPMDRLLCGDVGYGKTEVAMRAVFKAVNDSKQVAILVPTTILAQQHYNTIEHRFSKYPIRVGVLSRFRTTKEIKKILEDLRVGVIDVVIGTHRLLSKDVKFKDLGLLIVDEEQRFGVKHKERIKQLKTNIDVLTLSATPIPRTLHMSLVGIRDMSLIEDPPEDRYPIQTYVLGYQPNAIREAILREIDRNGQVYFVHNRVEDIDRIALRLAELVPEARITYAHGQMKEGGLEKKMLDFMNREYDVLVSTTIVETGLDISNVNTMIIYHADKFGLSQLYQLRGRVGRSNRLAYAYLTYEKEKILSEVAEKRLKAIKEFTDLGSGFKIAMRDLELRGSGSLLGAEQHGHMASIGYEMYCSIVETTVRQIKGEKAGETVDTSIEIPCEAYIPENYIGNAKFKIDLYKRISSVRSVDDKMDIENDLIDMYGVIPTSVINLIYVGYIRALAMKAGIVSVLQNSGEVVLSYSEAAKVNPLLISHVLDRYNERELKFVGSSRPYFKLDVSKIKKQPSAILNKTSQLLALFEEIKSSDNGDNKKS